uniref:Adipocyte plasma membrane-associated protein n=1 Tax=Caenorhabditis japonica TaxID=281687 RepID=A0A8R1I3Y8_CAEJA
MATKPSVRKRRGSDERVAPPLARKQKKSQKNVSVLSNLSSHPFKIILGAVASVIIAGLLTNRIINAPIKAVFYDLGDAIPLEGVLAVNDRLTDAELLLEDQVYGPESLALDEKRGVLYSGFRTGLIAEISWKDGKEKIGQAVRLAQGESEDECDGSYKSMPRCGRPLGLRISEIGELIIADAYLGLFAINWEAEKVVKILGAGEIPSNDEYAPPIKYLNDLDILPDGRIIMSESSTKFDDRDFILDIFEHRPNGRLLIYEPRKKSLRVLKDGLYFPNGVQLSIEKGAAKNAPWRVFYSEMSMARVMQIWVPQDHYSDAPVKIAPLIENLPGYPDNIRLTKSGHLLVPIPSHRSEEDRTLEQNPSLREFLTKILAPQALNYVANYFTDSDGLVLKVNTETGQVIESYHDPTGKIEAISIAIDDGKGKMLLGSDVNYYIARAKL